MPALRTTARNGHATSAPQVGVLFGLEAPLAERFSFLLQGIVHTGAARDFYEFSKANYEVLTVAGVTGLGSSYTSTDLINAALGRLRDLVIGEVAIEPERVHEKLEQSGFWWGRGGTITHAISGIVIALWDILGKATGQPVGRLLGGRYRDRVQPYASLLMQEPGPLAEQLRTLRSQGFRAFKIGWGPFGRRSAALGMLIEK